MKFVSKYMKFEAEFFKGDEESNENLFVSRFDIRIPDKLKLAKFYENTQDWPTFWHTFFSE